MDERRSDPLVVSDRYGNPAGLRDLWKDAAAFLVCGGPSLARVDIEALGRRGVASMGVNNASGYAPVRAHVSGDPPGKFHHGIWLDPGILKFIPEAKAERSKKNLIRVKEGGQFTRAKLHAIDCPSTFQFKRRAWFTPETFLTEDSASWGNLDMGHKKTGLPKTVATMLFGLRLLHYLGVRRVYLLGVDLEMSWDEQKYAKGIHDNYAWPEQRDEAACISNNDQYRILAGWLNDLGPVFSRAKFHVYNCNRASACTVYPHVPFEKAIADCRGHVPAEPFDLSGWYSKVQKD